MRDVLYLSWRYLCAQRVKTCILIAAVTLISYLPLGLELLVEQSAAGLTARAEATPLVIGAKGSPLELVLSTLYFRSETPEQIRWNQLERVREGGLATAIPIHTRFRVRRHPLIGTSLDYFAFRDLHVERGRMLAVLGECVVGAAAAAKLGVEPGDSVVSSPLGVLDIAGVYPLKMKVVGVLAATGSPDDQAVFVDVRTAWIIAGLGHGHQDLASPGSEGFVLAREGERIVANAAVVGYREVTASNAADFHFHGDRSDFPLTGVIVVPHDRRAGAILQGRYQGSGEPCQVVRPDEIVDELLATVFTVRGYVVLGLSMVGIATLATVTLVLLLSLRLRRREMETLFKIGGARGRVATIMAAEIGTVLVTGCLLAGALMLLTLWYGPDLMHKLLV